MTDAELKIRLVEIAAVVVPGLAEANGVRFLLRNFFEKTTPDMYMTPRSTVKDDVVFFEVSRRFNEIVSVEEYAEIYYSIFTYEPSDFLKL